MEIKNILLTGEIQVGKSTIINKIIEKYFKDKTVSGFKTLPFYEDGEKQGYYIENQLEKGVSSSGDNIVGRVIKEEQRCFGIKETFEKMGVSILESALNSNSELILIDELGFFENDAECFKSKIKEVIESDMRTIGVLKKKDTEFLNFIKSRADVMIIEVDKVNREGIEEIIKEYWKL